MKGREFSQQKRMKKGLTGMGSGKVRRKEVKKEGRIKNKNRKSTVHNDNNEDEGME